MASLFESAHWGLIVMRKSNEKIIIYDSMPKRKHTDRACVPRYFTSAPGSFAKFNSFLKSHLRLENWPMCWTHLEGEVSPKQNSMYDCGAFACAAAYYVSKNMSPRYSQRNIPAVREQIKYSILSKSAERTVEDD